MKKNIITIVLVGIIVLPIYGCGNRGKEIVEFLEAIEATLEESEETYRTPEQTEVQQTEDDKGTDPIYIIEPELIQNDTYEMQDWQAAYVEYIEGFEEKERCYYSLIYVDDDDIPELVIDTGFGAGGYKILTFHNGEVDDHQTDGRLFYYIEKKNLLNNTGGRMGYYFDRICSIENGKWVYVTGGEYRENPENRMEFLYEWEGKPVEEEEYEDKLDEVFDREQAKEPEQYERLDEMLFRLQMGTALSQTHRYELYVEDITWDEAKRRCEEKGGYLATITTTEEYECIKNGIEDSGQTQVAYWVGASDDYPSSYPIYEWREPNRDYLRDIFINYTIMGKYWADGEPSYFKQASDEQIDELGIYLLYDDVKEDWYLYDAPMDMLLRNPEYTGKIGYICEYDSVTVMAKETWFYPDDDSRWYEYEYDGAGNLTKEIYYNADGGINWWWENEYDRAGKQAKCICYNADGDIKYWYECEYDNTGNRTKTIEYRKSGDIARWYEWQYDSAGNGTKWVEYRYDGNVREWREYEYDSAGNMVKDTVHEPNINFEYIYEYEYDDAGNQTKESYYTNGSLMYWDEYEYDSTGNNVKDTMYNGDGSVRYIHEFEYDNRGNKTKKTTTYYPEDGRDTEYEWEYDNMGNLTRSKYVEYWRGELCDWSECEYEYITITPYNEVTISD